MKLLEGTEEAIIDLLGEAEFAVKQLHSFQPNDLEVQLMTIIEDALVALKLSALK